MPLRVHTQRQMETMKGLAEMKVVHSLGTLNIYW